MLLDGVVVKRAAGEQESLSGKQKLSKCRR